MTTVLTEWVASASALILVVLLLRGLLGKRISAGLRYALWAVVLVRLLAPGSPFAVTVPQLPKWTPPETMREENIYVLPVYSGPAEASGVYVAEDGTLGDPNSFGYVRLEDEGRTITRYAEKISPLELAGWVWAAGSAVFALVLLAANLRFSIRLRRVRRPLEGCGAPIPVYAASALPSPCLMGLLRPAVYVTEEAAADPVMLRHVLAHELTHHNHLDHLWSVLRGAALAVHWWNPLVWLAVVCSRRDGELACDEGALERLGDGERTAYGETLLALVTAKARPADLLSFATTMSGGKRSLKERIQRIARQPKTLVSAMVVVIAVLALSALVAFGQAKEETDSGVPLDPTYDDARLGDAWKTAEVTVDGEGVPHIRYTLSDGGEETWNGSPIPAPREWAGEDLAGRDKAEHLICDPDGCPEIRAKLVSETNGWLVATYGRGAAAADTYVYKTSDRGITWNEVTMPGTNWHIADVGFLSPDRLIVAQRLFSDAPCLITKDGGETWEEIELPDVQVLSIGYSGFDGQTVVMDLGKHEGDPATCSMRSSDMGETWFISYPATQTVMADLDHDGVPDMLALRKTADSGLTLWTLEFTASNMSAPTWESEAATAHAGWTSFFLCRMEGEDYLLQYTPYMGGGSCYYSYKLFYLTAGGEEVAVQENSVDFDLIFDSSFADMHQYDPAAINAFMKEINALLAHSEQLVNTDENLLGTFRKEGRLYDSIWWLDDRRDDHLSLLENLRNYGSYAQDHPDDTWSQLADLLEDLTEDDIPMFDGDTSELIRMLRAAKRTSRFYTWGSEAAAYQGAGADEVDYTIWNLPLADGNTLWLLACEERPNVLMIYETVEEAISAFYTAPELKELIQREEEFPSTQAEREFSDLKEENEKKWDEAQEAEYQAVGVTIDGKNYYYQGQLVNIFLDIRPNKSFYTLDMNPLGTVNIKIIRDADNKITGAAYMTEAEVTKLLEDMADPDDEWTDGQEITIPIEIVSVRDGEYIWLGTYDLAEDDHIYYHVSAEAGQQLSVGFAKPGQERPNPTYNTISNLRQEDEALEIKSGAIAWNVESGEYSLFIHTEGGTLTGVTGYVTIVKAK